MAGLFSPEERLITPPDWTGIDESLPVVFVGGPLQGAPDFQTPLAKRLIDTTTDVFVASPRQPEPGIDISERRQEWWEQSYLGRSAFNGVILFWLVARDRESGLNEQVYNQAAWFKFTQVLDAKNTKAKASVHLGIDPELKNSSQDNPDRYFRYLAKHAGFQIHESLEALESAVLEDLA